MPRKAPSWAGAWKKKEKKKCMEPYYGRVRLFYAAAQKKHKKKRSTAPLGPAERLFYGCSYRFHLSGDNSRDRYIKGS